MIGTIYISGVIGEDVQLLDVIKQVKNQSEAESFLVKIDSIGGYVETGTDIYNYLTQLGKPVTTFTTKAYSIASMIFLAGTTRIIPEGTEDAIMIHLPWMETAGNLQAISDHLKQLKATEEQLVEFYSKVLEIDKNTIYSLLSQETFLNATQALEMGFATALQPVQKAVAKLHNNAINNENLMNSLSQKLDSILNLLRGKRIKSELILQDAIGTSIVFPELNDGDTPSVEDKAIIDSKPAEGEFTMPDGTVYTFMGGNVKEISTPEEESTEVEEPVLDEALNQEAESNETELSNKVSELESKLNDFMTAEQAEKLVNLLETSIQKQTELESRFTALAKQVGSDFKVKEQETKTTIQAKNENLSRAAQILNSKF